MRLIRFAVDVHGRSVGLISVHLKSSLQQFIVVVLEPNHLCITVAEGLLPPQRHLLTGIPNRLRDICTLFITFEQSLARFLSTNIIKKEYSSPKMFFFEAVVNHMMDKSLFAPSWMNDSIEIASRWAKNAARHSDPLIRDMSFDIVELKNPGTDMSAMLSQTRDAAIAVATHPIKADMRTVIYWTPCCLAFFPGNTSLRLMSSLSNPGSAVDSTLKISELDISTSSTTHSTMEKRIWGLVSHVPALFAPEISNDSSWREGVEVYQFESLDDFISIKPLACSTTSVASPESDSQSSCISGRNLAQFILSLLVRSKIAPFSLLSHVDMSDSIRTVQDIRDDAYSMPNELVTSSNAESSGVSLGSLELSSLSASSPLSSTHRSAADAKTFVSYAPPLHSNGVFQHAARISNYFRLGLAATVPYFLNILSRQEEIGSLRRGYVAEFLLLQPVQNAESASEEMPAENAERESTKLNTSSRVEPEASTVKGDKDGIVDTERMSVSLAGLVSEYRYIHTPGFQTDTTPAVIATLGRSREYSFGAGSVPYYPHSGLTGDSVAATIAYNKARDYGVTSGSFGIRSTPHDYTGRFDSSGHRRSQLRDPESDYRAFSASLAAGRIMRNNELLMASLNATLKSTSQISRK